MGDQALFIQLYTTHTGAWHRSGQLAYKDGLNNTWTTLVV